MDEPKDSLLHASDFPVDTVLRDYTDPQSGLRYLVVRGFLSFCAYIGVPAEHPFAGLEEASFCPRQNYQRWGEAGTVWPEGYYWWGWDYARVGCVVDTSALIPQELPAHLKTLLERSTRRATQSRGLPRKNWTLGEVELDAVEALAVLKLASQASGQATAAALRGQR